MKKILSSLLLVALLATGCGEKNPATKVCTITQNGQSVDIELVPDGNKLKQMIYSMKQELPGITKEEADNFIKSVKKEFESDGIKVDISIDGGVATMKLIFNIKELDELPSMFQGVPGFEEGIKNAKFDELTKEMEDAGAKCK